MAAVRHLGLFPWCFDPENVYFKGVEIKDRALPMWWRVRKWLFEPVLTIRANGQDPEPNDYSYSFELNVEDQLPQQEETLGFGNFGIQKELDLVCVDKFDMNAKSDHVWELGQGLVDSYIVIGPALEIFIDQDDLVGCGSSTISFLTGETIGSGPKLGDITVKFHDRGKDVQFDVPMFAIFEEYTGNLYDLLAITGTLEAKEYWQYDPGDGEGPIYDKDSGKLLRPFPAIS